MKKNYWGALGVAAWVAWGGTGVAAAQQTTPQGQQKLSIHIESQPMAQALSELGDETGLSIIVASAATDGVRAPAVDGSYTADEALRKVLAPAGLRAEYLSKSTVAVRVAQSEPNRSVNTSQVERPATPAGAQQSIPQNAKDPKDREQPVKDDSDKNVVPTTNSNTRPQEGRGIPEILVKGSRVLNMDVQRSRDDVQPYVIFDRETIERSGAADIDDFLKQRLTMNTVAQSQAQQGSVFGNSSAITLRGLGANQTLILIDGHRTASYSVAGTAQQPDLNGIPLSAVERIEVLPTTASGIYGGSATGGVVNVILRRDYSGLEAKVSYGDSFDGGGATRRVDLSTGNNFNGGKTSVLLAGSYQSSNQLLVGERGFVQAGRNAIVTADPAVIYGAAAPPLGSTTNIVSSAGANLTLKSGTPLKAPFTFVPVAYAGAGSDGGVALEQNAGAYNLNLANTAQTGGGGAGSLLNGPIVKSINGTLRQQFTEAISAFIELGASGNEGRFLSSQASSTFSIPSSSPINPFLQNIRVTTPALGADGIIRSTQNASRAVGGAIFTLPQSWQAETDYTWSRTTFSGSTPGGLSAAAAQAVSSGAINVLQSASLPNFSPYVSSSTIYQPTNTTLKDATLRFAGPLALRLPGGDSTLALLAEHRVEGIDNQRQTTGTSGTLYPARSQTVNSAYAEVKVPVVSASNGIVGINTLDLQAAVRRDWYATTGASSVALSSTSATESFARNKVDSTDPTLGFSYTPTKDVMFRGSYGTGFLPPGVSQLVSTPPLLISSSTAALLGLTDPLRGNQPLGAVEVTGGGNASLIPEKSKTLSAGIVVTPRAISGFRASVDWTRIDKQDGIMAFALQDAINDFSIFVPSRITRAPTLPGDAYSVGPITAVDITLVNLTKARVEAYDLALDYRIDTDALGVFSISAVGTREVRNQTQVAPSAPTVENAGTVASVGWRSNGTLSWDFHDFTFAWTTRYFSGYWLNVGHIASDGFYSVPNQLYHDILLDYRIGSRRAGVLANTELQFGVTNVLNTRPPVDVTAFVGGGYLYSPLGDPRLATWYLSLRKKF